MLSQGSPSFLGLVTGVAMEWHLLLPGTPYPSRYKPPGEGLAWGAVGVRSQKNRLGTLRRVDIHVA